MSLHAIDFRELKTREERFEAPLKLPPRARGPLPPTVACPHTRPPWIQIILVVFIVECALRVCGWR